MTHNTVGAVLAGAGWWVGTFSSVAAFACENYVPLFVLTAPRFGHDVVFSFVLFLKPKFAVVALEPPRHGLCIARSRGV